MKKYDYPFLADWFVISLRWLILLGVTISLIVAQQMNWFILVGLIGSMLWNVYVTILAVTNRRLPIHRILNVGLDFVISVFLFFFGGGVTGMLPWVGLMPLFSSSLYFYWPVNVVVVFLLCVAQILVSLFINPISAMLVVSAIIIGFYSGAGAVFGILSKQLYKHLQQNFKELLRQRLDNELKVQKKERSRLQTFFKMIETLSETLNYEVVLETTLDLSISALADSHTEAINLVSAVLLFGEEDMHVGAARGFPSSDLNRHFLGEKGVLREVIQNAEPRLFGKPYTDPELNKILALQSCSSAYCLPLHRGLNSFGVMLYAHPDLDFFTEERREKLEMISLQTVIAIQNARLFKDQESEKERIIESQEEERKQLARDLHDGPTQSVSGMAMRAEYIRKLVEHETDPSEIISELESLEKLARDTTKDIRHMLFTLRPLVLENQGLVVALQTMADKMRETYQQNVLIDVDQQVIPLLDENKQTVIFQLSEEAVNNARKHAKASEILVRIRFIVKDNSIAMLEIIDNGLGFDVNAVTSGYEKRGSLGMINLRERADLINSVLHIDSAPGSGTKIQVAIPFTGAAADRLQRRRS
ncbi:MAG: hypothetical protein JEZ06_06930 [Anaerolineaceae bacterium]|nr:hypothetical protein [Anaerolineaceae bacterium]